jgi:glucose-6-phosphate isomerase
MNLTDSKASSHSQQATKLSRSPAWQALVSHRAEMAVPITELFSRDPGRAEAFSLDVGNLHLDYSKQRVTSETMSLLAALATQLNLRGRILDMFTGVDVNFTEQRPALHTALRSDDPAAPHYSEIAAARRKMFSIAEQVRNRAKRGKHGDGNTPSQAGAIDVINLGVGGSDLGPRLAVSALSPYVSRDIRLHFVSNADPADLDETLQGIDPASAFFIITSKSFSTVETLANADRAKAWLQAGLPAGTSLSARMAGVTARPEKAAAWGIDSDLILPMWDWVGGRYSLWSTAGLALAIAIGPDGFEDLLGGARKIDQHFRSTEGTANMPFVMAALSVWNASFGRAETLAILPYCHQLRELPAYLQQLQMESNGKHVDRDGVAVDYPTSPILWGAAGTVGQHSFHQLLHQGTHCVPSDFIVVVNGSGNDYSQRMLVSNAFAQAATLMTGTRSDDPHKVHPGNQPSSTILMNRITPSTLGQLLALYEHKVFVESVLLNINPFDQWGVELGKDVAKSIQSDSRNIVFDASTEDLLRRAEKMRTDHT